MPVVVTAVFRPAPGHHDDLVQALRATIPAVHEERGCLLYAIHDAEDGTITMIEKWASPADLDAHDVGPAVAALRTAVEGRLDGPVEVVRMEPLPVGDPDRGAL